jgi:prephenate dehydrogenase
MIGWIEIKHPITGETIKAVPTGRTNDFKAEVLVITPKSNLDKIWIEKEQLINKTELTP